MCVLERFTEYCLSQSLRNITTTLSAINKENFRPIHIFHFMKLVIVTHTRSKRERESSRMKISINMILHLKESVFS